MDSAIKKFQITRFEFPRERPIGDCRVAIPDMNWVGALELLDSAGRTGLGFFATLLEPLPGRKYLADYFENSVWQELHGQVPEAVLNRFANGHGEAPRRFAWDLAEAAELALWDLTAQRLELPLFRLLGGTDPRTPAYASGLCFHLSDAATESFYSRARIAGYRAYKVKVGHPDLEWDLRRLHLVAASVGTDARLMTDANEAWSLHEATRRLRAYRQAGFDIEWIEDPLPRHDYKGLQALRGSAGATRVNAGEYLNEGERCELLAAHGADILNLNGALGSALRVARACRAVGVPVSIGNSLMNTGAHLGAALSGAEYVEDSQLDWNRILRRPIPVKDGCYVLTEQPGHGLELSPDAVYEFARP